MQLESSRIKIDLLASVHEGNVYGWHLVSLENGYGMFSVVHIPSKA